MTDRPVIVGASAGSGKTTHLTDQVKAAVDPHSATRIPVDGLVAVTFTVRAAGELRARIRQSLVMAGSFDEAARLPLAYVGTVHGVCLRLLQELAIDAGLSPAVDVLPDSRGRALREALETALPGGFRNRLEELARRLEIRVAHMIHRVDWMRDVREIMDLARANRIASAALPAMATRSWSELRTLLETPRSTSSVLDLQLAAAVAMARRHLASNGDTSKGTTDVRRELEAIHREIERDGVENLTWSTWTKLAGITTTKASLDLIAPVNAAASHVLAHPRLHEDLDAYTHAAFEAAQIALDAYAQWKSDRGVVDYVDMIDRALTLLEQPDVAAELAARLRYVVVDELQDTSPIQLALFARLHAIAQRSTWVGDRKQCIFEFAGADPALMEAAVAWANGTGTPPRLESNYRSRPELVEMCSELFAAALAKHGVPRADVVVDSKREALPPDVATVPPTSTWWLVGGKKEVASEAVADGVRAMLATPSSTRVVDRATREPRDVRAGDVAVLVATNDEAMDVATALHARGIAAALAREGLLAMPEGTLADAALRLLLDPHDRLARANLDALHDFDGVAPGAWLGARVAEAHARKAGEAVDEPPPPRWAAALDALRLRLPLLSPAEALDAALEAVDAFALAARWPDAAQRRANLDALRALAAEYEDRAARIHEAATIAGLLRYFDDAGEKFFRDDEEHASDDQYVASGPDAVNVLTYHKAKGLEWPVVVLASLDRKPKAEPFHVHPETDAARFDPADPLAGRWIRYWPWPFGGSGYSALAARAESHPRGAATLARERHERARLLYVGFTRARDHLVLAVRRKSEESEPKTVWLDELAGSDGAPLVVLPGTSPSAAPDAIRLALAGGSRDFVTRIKSFCHSDEPERLAAAAPPLRLTRPTSLPTPRPSYRIAPSRAAEAWPGLPTLAPASIARLSHKVDVSSAAAARSPSTDWAAAGDAIHRFLASDDAASPSADRTERARSLLLAAGAATLFAPDAIVKTGDAVRAFVATQWPGAISHREVPIDALVPTPAGTRRVRGVIDLLVETTAGVVVIDYKSFPGASEAAWRAKAHDHAPQMAAYAAALRLVEGVTVLGTWLCFPVGGAMVELTRGPGL